VFTLPGPDSFIFHVSLFSDAIVWVSCKIFVCMCVKRNMIIAIRIWRLVNLLALLDRTVRRTLLTSAPLIPETKEWLKRRLLHIAIAKIISTELLEIPFCGYNRTDLIYTEYSSRPTAQNLHLSRPSLYSCGFSVESLIITSSVYRWRRIDMVYWRMYGLLVHYSTQYKTFVV